MNFFMSMIQIELIINSLMMNQLENMSWWIGLTVSFMVKFTFQYFFTDVWKFFFLATARKIMSTIQLLLLILQFDTAWGYHILLIILERMHKLLSLWVEMEFTGHRKLQGSNLQFHILHGIRVSKQVLANLFCASSMT